MKWITNFIAIAAFCLSIASAAFSYFQWWNGERETRISVAVEISKNYLKERDVNASGIVLKAISNQISKQEAEIIGRYADLLAYISFLTNRNRLDRSYLSDTIACDIFFTDKAIRNHKEYFGQPDPEMHIFIKANQCNAELPIHPQSN